MLRVKVGSDEIEIRFDHEFCDIQRIYRYTGVWVNEVRRCSLATVKLNGQTVSRGMAVCHPNDNFCRAIGRKKAMTYGLSILGKKLRTAVWTEYNIQCGF